MVKRNTRAIVLKLFHLVSCKNEYEIRLYASSIKLSYVVGYVTQY